MPLYTKSQIAEMCGKYIAQVSNAVGRGKFICNKDGYIDDSVYENKKLIDKWKAAKKAKGEKPAPTKKAAPKKTTTRKKSTQSESEDESSESELDTWQDRKLKAEVQYKENQAINWELRNAALKGENIPTDLVTGLIKMMAHVFQTQYKNNALNILTEVSHKTKMSNEDFAKFKGKLFESINKSHKSALYESKKGIKSVVSKVLSKENQSDGSE